MWLMQALGFLLSALQVEEILKNLHSLISPYIQQLEKLAEEIVSELLHARGCVCVVCGRKQQWVSGAALCGGCGLAAEGWAGSQGWEIQSLVPFSP